MNWLDIAILAMIGSIALAGLGMGGVNIAVTGAGVLAGIALSSRLQEQVRPLISRFTENDNAAELGAFIAIFIIVLIASVVVGFVARSLLKSLMLGWMDKLLGLGLGVVVSLAIGSAVLSTVQGYPVLGLEDTIDESTLGTFLADNFDVVLRTLRFVPDDLGT